jgi:hypothetical protein
MNKISKPTQTKIDKILQKLKIDDSLTKPIYYKFPKVKRHIFPKRGYNYQAVLLILPPTKSGYRYLLTMVDLWSNHVDFEPMKNKEAITTLQAMKEIFKRDYLKKPVASVKTDAGSEFKGPFEQYLFDNNFLHLVTLPDRHKQLGNVENLNKILGKILMTYLTHKSYELDKDYNEWIDIIEVLRDKINEMKNHPKNMDPREYIPPDISKNKPKYKVGDMVYRRLEVPKDRFGNKYMNAKFRAGDNRFETNEPRKIINIVAYSDSWRYMLNGFPNVSYDEAELKPAKEKEEKYIIHKIIDKKTIKGKVHYLVWWKRYNKGESTWEPKNNLLEDGADEYIQEYEDSIK